MGCQFTFYLYVAFYVHRLICFKFREKILCRNIFAGPLNFQYFQLALFCVQVINQPLTYLVKMDGGMNEHCIITQGSRNGTVTIADLRILGATFSELTA